VGADLFHGEGQTVDGWIDKRNLTVAFRNFAKVPKISCNTKKKMHYSVIYAYSLLRSLYMFRRYNVAFLQGADTKMYLTQTAANMSQLFFDILLTVHLSIFISVINQIDEQNFVLQ